MIKKKYLIFAVGILFIFMLAVKSIKVNHSLNLTVTNIHDKITLGKTSQQDIKKLFGKPDVIEQNSSIIQKNYEKWSQDETGINFFLSDGTDYWETVNFINDGSSFSDSEFTLSYQYEADTLGLKAVYFFFIDDRLEAFVFDDTIKNKKAVETDSYLKDWTD